MKEWKSGKPSYFLVIFGDKHSLKYPIDGGVYPMTKKGRIGDVSIGDILLLYQNSQTPGIGLVIDTETDGERDIIDYQYFELNPIVNFPYLECLRTSIPELRTPLPWHLVQPISKASFIKAVDGAQLNWP